jgi:hypothetical protein
MAGPSMQDAKDYLSVNGDYDTSWMSNSDPKQRLAKQAIQSGDPFKWLENKQASGELTDPTYINVIMGYIDQSQGSQRNIAQGYQGRLSTADRKAALQATYLRNVVQRSKPKPKAKPTKRTY